MGNKQVRTFSVFTKLVQPQEGSPDWLPLKTTFKKSLSRRSLGSLDGPSKLEADEDEGAANVIQDGLRHIQRASQFLFSWFAGRESF